VPGFNTEPRHAGEFPWFVFTLPDFVRVQPLSVTSIEGDLGTLVVVDGLDFADYSDQLFDEEVQVVADSESADGELPVITGNTRPTWRTIEGMPVIGATVPDVDGGQWVWEHDGRTFVAVGSLAMETYVAGLVAAQQATLPRHPHEYGVLLGNLDDRRIFVPGYEYANFPVDQALATMALSAVGDCAENLHVGYVVPAGDPDPNAMGPEDVGLVLATVSDVCRDGGFFEQLPTALAGQGLVEATVAGKTAWQDPTRLILVEDDLVIQLNGSDATAFAAMRPFIDRFVAGVEPTEVLDLTPLPIPTCLYQVPAGPGENQLDQPAYVVDCVTPHQGELYHHNTVTADAGTPYPGDAAVDAEANLRCYAAFEPYVGLDFNSSRLGYLYFYPNLESWAEGDRGIDCILFAGDGELLTGSLAGTAQ
jgi:hypothetical protein